MTLTDRLASYFVMNRGEWIRARRLFFAGECGWRTRVSSLRTQRGMRIENRLRYVRHGKKRMTISEYRHQP